MTSSYAPDALSIVHDPEPSDMQYLDERLYEFNAARSGIDDGRLFGIFVRDDADTIVGGLHGWTWGRCCEVKTLWVHEAHRGRGLGTRLMAAAEVEARMRGAVRIMLSTHTFQAPDFYAKLGFVRVGHVDDCPAGAQSIFLEKRLR